MAYLERIRTALPAYRYTQDEILGYMQAQLNEEDVAAQRLQRAIYKKSGIAFRHSVLPDFNKEHTDKELFVSTGIPDVSTRMDVYKKEAFGLAHEAAMQTLGSLDTTEITHIITVSCTGMVAPGLEVKLSKSLGLKPNVVRQAVNFMGCHASFHALRMAKDICSTHALARVLIVSVELCTLHFQKEDSNDQRLANALFADGAAAALVSSHPIEKKNALRLRKHNALLIQDSEDKMAWEIGNNAFDMKLSGYIPQLLEQNISLEDIGVEENIAQKSIWAVHPGGKRILDKVHDAFGLRQEQLSSSYEVLSSYGNMSSATILFVLAEIMRNHQSTPDTTEIQAIGFGPGLSVEHISMEFAAQQKPDFSLRSNDLELLDAPEIEEADLHQNLAELHTINTYLGGYSTIDEGVQHLLNQCPENEKIKLVDIGSGGGDTIAHIKKRFGGQHPLSLTGVDLKEECNRYAAQKGQLIEFVTSDYRDYLQSAKQKTDIAMASLFCHHLTDNQIIDLLHWLKNNTKVGFVLNDIHRHPLAYYSIKWITKYFSKSPLVKNDAPLSVLRAFRRRDWEMLLEKAGITQYQLKWKWAFRWLVVVESV